jgi:hypothetical protein
MKHAMPERHSDWPGGRMITPKLGIVALSHAEVTGDYLRIEGNR